MNARTELLSTLVETAMENHHNQIRIVASVEDKAQKTSTVAGLFLAAAFGFTRPEILRTVFETYLGPALFMTTLGLLVVCILLCLSVNWVRRMPGAVTVFAIEAAARHVLSLPADEISEEIREAYLEVNLELWKRRLESYARSIVKRKARLLFSAQLTLLAAVCMASGTLVLLVLRLPYVR